LDNHEEFKGRYTVMDNAPIHISKDIERYDTYFVNKFHRKTRGCENELGI
jgi:hypothetical protein